MPSQKPRIATYTTKKNVRKLKIISAYSNMSMSEYLEFLIDSAITDYENENGEIIFNDEDDKEDNSPKNVRVKNILQNGDNNSINIS